MESRALVKKRMILHKNSIIVFFVVTIGYYFQSILVHLLFYYFRSKTFKRWKIQPNNQQTLGALFTFPFLPKPVRAPYHGLITTFNLLMAGLFALFVTEVSLQQLNKMTFSVLFEYSFPAIFKEVVIACTHQCVLEYYWHRCMHTRYLYAKFHKYHHFYKSPEPFDDMYIHPLEAFGYYCILYSPPFIYAMHYSSFLVYMIIMGVFGVLDHSGVKIDIPGFYNTVDHDNHHKRFEVNYSFPFPYMDILHGTYHGTFLNLLFTSNRTPHER